MKMFELSLCFVRERYGKYLFIFIIFTLLVAMCASVFFITGSLRQEAAYTVDSLPDITVTKMTAGRPQFIKRSAADSLLEIAGVSSATPRVWGDYRYDYLNTNLRIIGVDPFAVETAKDIQKAADKYSDTLLSGGSMITGKKLADTLYAIYNHKQFSFQTPEGDYVTLNVAGTFKSQTSLMSASAVLTDNDSAAKILGIDDRLATDIAVYTPNPDETDTIAEKIKQLMPDVQVTTRKSVKAYYQNLYDFKTGTFLLIFSVALLTFIMIAADRFSGTGGQEKREIAVLKALGYTVPDILRLKIYEAFSVALLAFVTGIMAALFYVYFLHAPLLSGLFTGYAYLRPELDLPFRFSVYEITLLFLTTVPVYTAAVVIPAWKSAVADAGESLR